MGIPRSRALKKHPGIGAREPRTVRAHEQDRRAEAAMPEMLSGLYGSLERRLVEERDVAVYVAEVQVYERVE